MESPFEIVAAPVTLYLAAFGTAFPDVSVAPPSPWVRVGVSGDKSYAESGVSVEHKQDVAEIRTLGCTGPVKAVRTKEGLSISLELIDISLETYRRVLNDVAITDVATGAGTAGIKKIPLKRGINVANYAAILRGDFSPEGDGFATQYLVPKCYMGGSPKPTFKKSADGAGLMFEMIALEDLSANDGEEFGWLEVQDADPS